MAFVPEYILILFFTIIIDYFAGIFLEKVDVKYKKTLLIISLISNIGILAIFKYYNFIGENIMQFSAWFLDNPVKVKPLSEMLNWGMKVVLPIGLSFHTFQAMSYTIEVYRGNQKAEKHFGIYALYVMFYPQLVAGPIERPQNVLPQFHTNFKFDFENLKAGLMQMAWGFFKKVVVADRLGIMVDGAYNHDTLANQNGFTLLLATFFYTFQIYCDFSGYSDIAIGSAKAMGFDLMQNFKTPYFSKSIAEFWNRWHISLSTWFRDYLYIPLGGNRVKEGRVYFNLFLVFLISGLWHGSQWNFVIWGAIHGFYLVFAQIKNKYFKNILPNFGNDYFNMTITFILVMLAWIFFRASSFIDAIIILSKIFNPFTYSYVYNYLNNFEILFGLFVIFILMIKEKYWFEINTKLTVNFYLIFTTIALFSYLFGVFQAKQFIYFQF